MKIFAISDLHLSTVEPKPMDIFGGNWDDYWQKIECDWQDKVDDEDIVLIPGDTSWAMRMCDAIPDLQKIANLKGKKVLLRGNHDYWWNTIGKVCDALPDGMYADGRSIAGDTNAVQLLPDAKLPRHLYLVLRYHDGAGQYVSQRQS